MKIIAAVSGNGIIGINGKIPWRSRDELAYFKSMTINKTVIMGRKTYESIGEPLPLRRNIVIAKHKRFDSVETYPGIGIALDQIKDKDEVWFCGGYRIYKEAIQLCNEIWLTVMPFDVEDDPSQEIVRFPFINPIQWKYKLIPGDNVDNLVNQWHQSNSKQPIHEYLGLTLRQYALWVQNIRIAKYVRRET